MSFDLTNKNIQDTFQNLLQKTGSDGSLFDLEGNQIDDITLTNVSASGHISASKFIGDGSGLSGLSSAAISTYNNAGDNRIITSVNSTTVQGESNLKFNSSNQFIVNGDISSSGAINTLSHITASGNISSSGTIIGSNLSGTNTGDQDLSSLALKTAITGAFAEASSSFSTRLTTTETELGNTLLSSSAQIADDISGSFVQPSSSFSTRTTDLETASGSFSTRVTGLQTDSASFSTRLTTAESELGNTLISSSAQIASDISGSFGQPSSSFSTRVTTLEGNSVFSADGISGSLGSNATLIRSLTAASISGSFVQPSSSFSTRVTTLEANPVFSSDGISGSLGSNATLIRSLTAAGISGSFTDASASFSTRLTTEEDNVNALQNDSGSFNVRVSALEGDVGQVLTTNSNVTFNNINVGNITSSGNISASGTSHKFGGDILNTTVIQMENSSSVINTFNTGSHQTCKYLLQVTSASIIQSSELLVMQSSSDAFNTEYAQMNSGLNLVDFSSKVNGENVELIGSSSFISCSIKLNRKLL